MHKCIPYESSIVFPINEHAKFQFSFAKTIPGLYWGNDHQQPRCGTASGGTPPNSNLTVSFLMLMT